MHKEVKMKRRADGTRKRPKVRTVWKNLQRLDIDQIETKHYNDANKKSKCNKRKLRRL